MTDRSDMKKFVDTWKRAGPELERIRREEMDALSLSDFIEAMDISFKMVWADTPLPTTSGLIQFHAILSRSRK